MEGEEVGLGLVLLVEEAGALLPDLRADAPEIDRVHGGVAEEDGEEPAVELGLESGGPCAASRRSEDRRGNGQGKLGDMDPDALLLERVEDLVHLAGIGPDPEGAVAVETEEVHLDAL